MALGDQFRQISPFDRWIEDANGNIVGIQNRRGEYSRDIRFLTEDKVAATEALVSEYENGTLGAAVLSIAAPNGTDDGDVLTATPKPGWTVGSYQWTRDGADIIGATSSTYTITLADQGALLGCRAGSPVYSALISIPAGSYPAGYLSLDGGVLALDGGILSLI